MKKRAGEMDEGSVGRQVRDRDGWSEESGCIGTQLCRDNSQMNGGDLGEALERWQVKKLREKLIMSKDWENEVCVCVQKGETETWGETWRERGLLERIRRGNGASRDANMRMLKKSVKTVQSTKEKDSRKRDHPEIRSAQHLLLHPSNLRWWH